MAVIIKTVLLLTCSNPVHDLRMVCAPQEHVLETVVHRGARKLGNRIFRIHDSVPANRIGYTQLSLAQLKILQEVITLSVFVPFSILYMKEGFKLDFIWAGLCLVGAVYFMFRT